ncbi:MAG: sugar phosphate nucleotidyltransferase [Bacteroidia bacterium]|nr:sugar phosphate nucleotidyltransferase [Bacteroidia bacterium]MCX7652999.1 sugar phosphate nucleotidyltransferase [Bacteroidia bacterium]MDW8416137.1 sugar phosphate nucleotidyltransferase [Bacteroidia bacterium]
MIRVVLPVAGAGQHLRPHTYTQPKPLIPIAGKPLIAHIVDELVHAGFTEFVFVLGYLSEKVRSYLLQAYEGRIGMEFVHQEPRLGLAHAISLTRLHFARGESMVIILGDTILRVDWNLLRTSPQSRIGIASVDRPSDFGIAEISKEGRILRVVEKPRIPRSNQALVGLYLIHETEQLFRAIDYLMEHRLTSHGEYQLTDALQWMIENGVALHALPVEYWLDCEKKETLLAANRLLLDRGPSEILPEYPHTVIIPPVHIPLSCKLYRAIVGPYVSLGEGVELQNTVVQDSIIGSYSRVRNMLLRESVIGGDALLVGREGALNLGENTVIEL